MTLPRLSRSLLCLTALVTALLPSRASAEPPLAAPPGTDRLGIQTAYDEINTAFSQHDLNRFMAYFTPDYISVDPEGEKRDKDQERKYYQDLLKKIKTMQCRYNIQSIAATPAGTLVNITMHSDGVGERRVLFMKLHGTFTNDVSVRDLWVNTPDGWRLKSRQTLLNQTHTHPG